MSFYAALGMIVARHRPFTKEGKIFLGYLLVLVLWSFGSVMVRVDFPNGSTLFWNQFLGLWPVLTCIVYFHFVKVFLRKEKHYFWVIIGYLFFLISAFAIARGWVIEQAYVSEGTYYVKFGLGFYIIGPIAYCFLGAAIYWLVKEFRTVSDPFVRNRVGYLLIGISILAILTATNFIPSLARYPIDQMGNVINALLLGYAILKYKLLDINIVIRKGFLYAALSGFIVAVYFVVAAILHVVFQTGITYVSWVSILIVAIFVAVIFHPLYRVIQEKLDRLFERKKYDYRLMLRRSSQAMASLINLNELMVWILDKIPLTVGAEKASILLLNSEKQQYCLEACKGYENVSARTIGFRHDSVLSQCLSNRNNCLTAEELEQLPQFSALWKSERETLKKIDVAVFVPLKAQETLIGMLVLGCKKSGDPYTNDDLDLLSTVANQVATSVRNAQLYQKSRQAYNELEEAQYRLIQAERLKALGEVTSGVAHDFNNILTTILGRAQLSLSVIARGGTEGGKIDTKIKQNLQLIEQAALDAAETVRRLQDFARLRTDRATDIVDINEIIKSALEMITLLLDERGETKDSRIEVSLNLCDVGPVEGSSSGLKEVIVNILINAIEAMPQRGKLTIHSKREDDSNIISINDTGAGMTSEVKKRVFEPFFTTKGSKGSGMGLSVAYGIITRHKGQMNVNSQPQNGSTFTLVLPIANKIRKKDVVKEMEPANANHAKVLVIEDNEGSREILYEILTDVGYEVDTADNGKDGISLAIGKEYELVIADLGLPDISGLEVATKINTHHPRTPIILVTGWGGQLNLDGLKIPGVKSVIAKPFKKDEILSQLAKLLINIDSD